MEILIIILVLIMGVYSLYWFKKYQIIIERQAKEIVNLRTTNNALAKVIENIGGNE